jgi:tRNA threonylcarbamoyladenosine biosynthesis protein TsaE
MGIEIKTYSPDETAHLGEAMGRGADGGLVLALTGELGSGKTKLTQGIAKGLGVPEDLQVTSPTFTLINEYPGRLCLYHFDLYRISGADELIDLGYEEYFYGDGVVVIEWAERAKDLLPPGRVDVGISILGEDIRKFVFDFRGNAFNLLKHEILSYIKSNNMDGGKFLNADCPKIRRDIGS